MRILGAATWLVVSVALTVPAFLWHLTQFTKPGAAFVYLVAGGLACLSAATFFYHSWRRRTPSRLDPWLLAAPPVAILIGYRPLATLAVALIAASAWLLGAEVLARLRLDCRIASSMIALPALAGFGIYTLVLFAAGTMGCLVAPLWIALALGPWLFWRRLAGLGRAICGLAGAWKADPDLRNPMVPAAAIFGAALAVLTAVMAVLPATAFDAVAAHLPLARSYLASHSLQAPGSMDYGWYPQAFEILAAFAWFFGGQAASQILAACFFVLAVLTLVALASGCGLSRLEQTLAGILAISVPAIHWTGSVPKNDLLMAAWQIASLYAVLRWHKERSRRWLLLSAAMLGMAFEVKHIALFGAVPIGLLWVYAMWKGPKRAQTAAAVLGTFLAFGSFSVIRTWLATGNPVYPESASRSVGLGGTQTAGQRVARWVRLPVDLQFDGGRRFESSSRSPLGAGFFVFLPFALRALLRRRTWEFRACFFFAGVYLLYWSLIIPFVLRYAIPALMVVCIPLAGGLAQFLSSAPRWLGRIALAAFVYCLCFGWLVAVMIGSYPAEIAWLTGKADDSAYLRATVEPFGAMEFLARNAHGDDVLGISACAGLYAPDPDRLYALCGPTRQYPQTVAVKAFRRQPGFRWVVVANVIGPDVVRALEEVRPLRHAYGDRWYSVYSVGESR